MKRLTQAQKIEGLTNFLRMVSTNESLYIQPIDGRLGSKFGIANREFVGGGVNVHSNYMTYEEMNCYFMGVLAVKENRVKFD